MLKGRNGAPVPRQTASRVRGPGVAASAHVRTYIRQHHLGLIAIFIALSGTAYAVDGPLPGQNQVGSADIINGEVQTADIKDANLTTADIRANAVTTGKIADSDVRGVDVQDNGLTGADVADTNSLGGAEIGGLSGPDITDDSLTGADVDDGSLTPADTSGLFESEDVFWAVVARDGRVLRSSNGLATTLTPGGPGSGHVEIETHMNRFVDEHCAYVAGVHDWIGDTDDAYLGSGEATAGHAIDNAGNIGVKTYNSAGTLTGLPFTVIAICP
jgi:hypothetical protein